MPKGTSTNEKVACKICGQLKDMRGLKKHEAACEKLADSMKHTCKCLYIEDYVLSTMNHFLADDSEFENVGPPQDGNTVPVPLFAHTTVFNAPENGKHRPDPTARDIMLVYFPRNVV